MTDSFTYSDETSLKASLFNSKGFLVIPDVISLDEINSMRIIAMNNFHAVNTNIEIRDIPLGVGIKEGYKEIVQRHLSRFEMPFKMDNDIFDIAACNPIILGIVTSILGADHKIINRSLVISLPGANDQSWHSDGPHLSLTEDLPCHCLNVFIPLVDIDMVNGPTSFRPESCAYTRDLSKLYMKAFMKKALKPIESPCLKRGSILMFDYRVLHRGLANKSTEESRPVLVLTFAKPWFQDVLNFPHKSIFDPKVSCPIPA